MQGLSQQAVRLRVGVDSSGHEQENDDGGDDDADDLEALQPLLVVPADGLEHAPETVLQMQEQGDEPHDVQGYDPPFAEGGHEQGVGIVLIVADAEHLGKLHLGPEMGEMESQQAQDQDTEDGHILGTPAVVLGLGSHLIAFDAATADVVVYREPDAIGDMDDEAQGQDGNHDADETGGHEVAAQFEQTVTGREKTVIGGDGAELSVEGINDREEIDGSMEQQEDNEESTGDALDELLADRGR